MILLLWGCMLAPYQLENAIHNQNTVRLIDTLQNAQHSYLRERAAKGLRKISPKKNIPDAESILIKCISSSYERDFVRTQCAQTLGAWEHPQAAELIVAAMPQVDTESRYWMAYTLSSLSQPAARAQLHALRNDSDLFLATAVKEWLGE